MNAEDNLKKMDLKLPKAPDPVGSYVATKISNKFLFISGQISMDENGNLIKGKLGKDLNTDKGYQSCRKMRTKYNCTSKKSLWGRFIKN